MVDVPRVGEDPSGGELGPLSRDSERYERLRSAPALYRLTLGQPRQEDLVDMLARRGADADELPTIDLRAPGSGKRDVEQPAGATVFARALGLAVLVARLQQALRTVQVTLIRDAQFQVASAKVPDVSDVAGETLFKLDLVRIDLQVHEKVA